MKNTIGIKGEKVSGAGVRGGRHEPYVEGTCYWPMAYGQMPGDMEND